MASVCTWEAGCREHDAGQFMVVQGPAHAEFVAQLVSAVKVADLVAASNGLATAEAAGQAESYQWPSEVPTQVEVVWCYAQADLPKSRAVTNAFKSVRRGALPFAYSDHVDTIDTAAVIRGVAVNLAPPLAWPPAFVPAGVPSNYLLVPHLFCTSVKGKRKKLMAMSPANLNKWLPESQQDTEAPSPASILHPFQQSWLAALLKATRPLHYSLPNTMSRFYTEAFRPASPSPMAQSSLLGTFFAVAAASKSPARSHAGPKPGPRSPVPEPNSHLRGALKGAGLLGSDRSEADERALLASLRRARDEQSPPAAPAADDAEDDATPPPPTAPHLLNGASSSATADAAARRDDAFGDLSGAEAAEMDKRLAAYRDQMAKLEASRRARQVSNVTALFPHLTRDEAGAALDQCDGDVDETLLKLASPSAALGSFLAKVREAVATSKTSESFRRPPGTLHPEEDTSCAGYQSFCIHGMAAVRRANPASGSFAWSTGSTSRKSKAKPKPKPKSTFTSFAPFYRTIRTREEATKVAEDIARIHAEAKEGKVEVRVAPTRLRSTEYKLNPKALAKVAEALPSLKDKVVREGEAVPLPENTNEVCKLMEGWSKARMRAYAMIDRNPNGYYYRFNAPGEAPRKGPFTQEEHAIFLKRLEEMGGPGRWGLLSIGIPGRVGYQCSGHYRRMIEAGVIVDPTYKVDESGRARYLEENGKFRVHPRVGARQRAAMKSKGSAESNAAKDDATDKEPKKGAKKRKRDNTQTPSAQPPAPEAPAPQSDPSASGPPAAAQPAPQPSPSALPPTTDTASSAPAPVPASVPAPMDDAPPPPPKKTSPPPANPRPTKKRKVTTKLTKPPPSRTSSLVQEQIKRQRKLVSSTRAKAAKKRAKAKARARKRDAKAAEAVIAEESQPAGPPPPPKRIRKSRAKPKPRAAGDAEAMELAEIEAATTWKPPPSFYSTKRLRGLCPADDDVVAQANPLPGYRDPIMLEEVVAPAISPYGHVMGYATWRMTLETRNNVCPFTNQPLELKAIVPLTLGNIDEYRDKIIGLD
ncbi:uncharacterized protein AMSG_04087 [Thecamonas trahens ATCC 50062]|uniref:Uncharacterized protein n=1 Tax=Thecamonas trahens ATCC 50062 TaxID=461836 RepID=A0A0L0D646_THETB|nr:hypothetical protein AMSG_04087 [Thecamonas trahens ATCC 50062]KNC47857.1 hypothetical protein AMSG_04087 [Thecamonas trahens ATCC 50062]|eukprot:XP_013759335.1 hypothetical protein AMSG_04087 [Thecamonas trahens ATCC 50062]